MMIKLNVKYFKFYLLPLLFFVSLNSHADADLIDYGGGMTISAIGVGAGNGGQAYFDLAEQTAKSKGCTWERYYINLDTPAGVATYATLLNAHNRGKKLRRLHFFQTANPGSCIVNLIELVI